MAPRKTYIIGVGKTKYEKPRNRIGYEELGLQAATKALLDAGINYDDIQQAYVGYVYGDSTCGQRALYALGMTQIPIVNVNNNCSTGSSALYLASQMVESGACECTMALGFEKMAPGSLANAFNDRTNPLDKTLEVVGEIGSSSHGPFAARVFGSGGEEYCKRFGATWEDIAAIASKNHAHSANNPYSQFQNTMTVEEVLAEKKVSGNVTRAMCCPTSDGGACAIVASEDFVKAHKLENQAIEIASLAMTTDSPKLFSKSAIELTGADMSRRAAQRAYSAAGITPQDERLRVIECHDCFAPNELLLYDALGLAEPGKAHELVRRKDNTYGGRYLVNPSGGLESKGHPLGATGLGNVFYLAMQLRGWAGPMQAPEVAPNGAVKDPHAMLHNLGLGGSCVVGLFRRPDFYQVSQGGEDGRQRLGYNHGCECREVTQADVDKVKSKKAFSPYAAARL
ncbi:thiolase-like protein [Cystobasidium minutum MCA 4210]|uniref:thiolase-like protein n=1 Tax=Cystobasidium minutum MCA 4210 TaxID=1397322 RepID=UPI0034CF84BD|eukprot:jgi/Rhomi1/194784/gm1.2998_g